MIINFFFVTFLMLSLNRGQKLGKKNRKCIGFEPKFKKKRTKKKPEGYNN